MPNVLIRDLPDEVHRVLLRRADQEGRSLQQYLTQAMTRLAAAPTLDDVLDFGARLHGGRVSLAEALVALTASRAER
jgi:plasmid stability protein